MCRCIHHMISFKSAVDKSGLGHASWAYKRTGAQYQNEHFRHRREWDVGTHQEPAALQLVSIRFSSFVVEAICESLVVKMESGILEQGQIFFANSVYWLTV